MTATVIPSERSESRDPHPAGDAFRCTQVERGMKHLLRSRPALALALALAAACSDSTTSVTPVQAAGVYRLESVSGRGPASGTFMLTADGRAARQVRYASEGGLLAQTLLGSFTINGTTIAFNLVPADSPASYVWPVSGQWLGSQFTISYPDPADGPDIVERYRRL